MPGRSAPKIKNRAKTCPDRARIAPLTMPGLHAIMCTMNFQKSSKRLSVRPEGRFCFAVFIAMSYRRVTYTEQIYYILRFWIKERIEKKAGAKVKPWAEAFYKGDAWQQCRAAFLASKHYLCERCSTPDNPVVAKIAHHKVYLNERNVADPSIALSWGNLEALCQDCHNKEHHKKQGRRYDFDKDGNVIPRG